MNRIILNEKDYEHMRNHLLRGMHSDEEAAFMIASTKTTKHGIDLLVKEVIPVPPEALLTQSSSGLQINPDFISIVVKRCRQERRSLLLAHSHPFSSHGVGFSSIDDYGEQELMPKIVARVPDRVHGTMVFGRRSLDARLWAPEGRYLEVSQVKVIGRPVKTIIPTSSPGGQPEQTNQEEHARQVLAFTQSGQTHISNASVGIVGVGGIGSIVFHVLVRLGVEDITVIDDDLIEGSNLSRVVGSRPEDVAEGLPKVEIMRRLGQQISPGARITPIKGTVIDLSVASRLLDLDVIFCCTDTHSSRMVLTRICSQYLIPLIDMGVDIQPSKEGKIRRVGGRVMVLLPTDPCLDCLGVINPEIISREMAADQYVHTPYVQGVEDEHDPAVISFNGTLASLAVTEFINLMLGCFVRDGVPTYQVYDGIKGEVRLAVLKPVRNCGGVCAEARAAGDHIGLPCRLDR